MDTDMDLLERWRAGDKRAGNELFKRHFDSICRFFENKIQGDVDELVQATFLACVRSRDQFRQQSSFRTYLFTIARNELYGFLRDRRRDDQRLDFGVTSVADLGMSPRSRLARDQEHERLLRALRSLPVDQQTLLELFYWENASTEEIAEIFEVAPVTARTRLHRARQALRELIESPDASEASADEIDARLRSLHRGKA